MTTNKVRTGRHAVGMNESVVQSAKKGPIHREEKIRSSMLLVFVFFTIQV